MFASTLSVESQMFTLLIIVPIQELKALQDKLTEQRKAHASANTANAAILQGEPDAAVPLPVALIPVFHHRLLCCLLLGLPVPSRLQNCASGGSSWSSAWAS